MRQRLMAITLVAMLVSMVVSLAVPAMASPKEKVTICHATAAVKNPYVRITVAVSAADGIAGNSGKTPDHYGEHTGPVFSEGVSGWGDIIPPIDGAHEGRNWTKEGRAIYDNGCKIPSPPEETTTTTTIVEEEPPAETTTTTVVEEEPPAETTTTTVVEKEPPAETTTTTVPELPYTGATEDLVALAVVGSSLVGLGTTLLRKTKDSVV